LHENRDCFGPATQAHFAKLAKRWQRTAESLSPQGAAQPGMFTRLQKLFAR
jgi:hypothetical protein